jgi:hypothetical protein
MTRRLPLVLSLTALAVAVFASTPLGHAVTSAVPFAKRAGFANRAGNAAAVNGIKAARSPRPGLLVPLGTDGKLPASVGQVGPKGDKGEPGAQGPKGDTGPPGAPGASGYRTANASSGSDATDFKQVAAECPEDMKVVGGGAIVSPDNVPVALVRSFPEGVGGPGSRQWFATAREFAPTAVPWSLVARAICMKVAS